MTAVDHLGGAVADDSRVYRSAIDVMLQALGNTAMRGGR